MNTTISDIESFLTDNEPDRTSGKMNDAQKTELRRENKHSNYPDMIVMPQGRYFFGDPRAVIKDDEKWAALVGQGGNVIAGNLDGFEVVAFKAEHGIYRADVCGARHTMPVSSGYLGMVPVALAGDAKAVKALYELGAVYYVSPGKTGAFNDNGVLRFAVSRDYLFSADPKTYGKCLKQAVNIDTRSREVA